MRLTALNCSGIPASELSPLKGMPLTSLHCGYGVSNLAPLEGMPLKFLDCYTTKVTDLTPLHGIQTLTSVGLLNTKVPPAAVAALQKALPNCKIGWKDPG
jgi:internalin A